MCVVFLTSNHAEHIKVLTTALYAPLRLTERERKARERDYVFHCPQCWSVSLNSPQRLISHTVWPHTILHRYTHLNKWAKAKEWDTVSKGDKTFYPQCWTCHNAVLFFHFLPRSSILFHLMGLLLWLADRNTQYHLFLKEKRIKIDHGVTAHSNSSESVTLVWMHCHLLDEWHSTGHRCNLDWTLLFWNFLPNTILALISGHRSFRASHLSHKCCVTNQMFVKITLTPQEHNVISTSLINK